MATFSFGSLRSSTSEGSGKPLGLGTRIFMSLFFGVFLGAGLLFTSFLVRSTLQGLATYRWKATPCTITSSQSEAPSPDLFALSVVYRYTFAGREYAGNRYRLGYKGSSDASKAERLAVRYSPGAETTCFVNPSDPSSAILLRSRPWEGLFIFFPLIFVVIGAGGIYAMWRRQGPKPLSGGGVTEPLSALSAKGAKGGWFLVLFFSLFLLVGLVATYLVLVKPMLHLVLARSWPAVECTIVSSEVGRHEGDEGGTTYSVNVLYQYEVRGRLYKSNRYDFLGGSSSGYDGKAEIVSRYVPGESATCFVSPNDPTDAVLERDFRTVYLLGLLPLLFVAVGAGGMRWAFGRMRRLEACGAPRPESPEATFAGPVTLKPPASPLAKLTGAILAAAFWNGIVSVFLWQMVEGWRHGHPDGCLTVFLIPFVLVGLGLLGFVGYQFLALFNPRIHVTLSSRAIPLGRSAEVEWRFAGNVSRIGELRITLEGREEATYRRGTSTTTDKHTFASIPIATAVQSQAMAQGRALLTIPADSVPSFTSANNKVVWALKVHGDIAKWPDVDEEFPLTILPLAPGDAP